MLATANMTMNIMKPGHLRSPTITVTGSLSVAVADAAVAVAVAVAAAVGSDIMEIGLCGYSDMCQDIFSRPSLRYSRGETKMRKDVNERNRRGVCRFGLEERRSMRVRAKSGR